MYKKIIIILVVVVACITVFAVYQSRAGGNLCFMCGSGSSCDYCVSPSGNDTQADREYCKKQGCQITGYTSCPSAANYKYCK